MNIYLGEKAKAILDDENALKKSLAEFLKVDENSILVAKLLMRLKISRINPELLVMSFMSLGFHFWAGLLTSFVYVYRRLYLGFIISFFSSIVLSYFLGGFFLIPFLISIFAFGKLYEYFLIKKYIDILNTEMPVANKCSPNILGVVILAIINIFYTAIYIFTIISAFSLFFGLNSVRDDAEYAKGISDIQTLALEIKSNYVLHGNLDKNIKKMSYVNINDNGDYYVSSKPCVNFSVADDKLIVKNINSSNNQVCKRILDYTKVIETLNANLNQQKESVIKLDTDIIWK